MKKKEEKLNLLESCQLYIITKYKASNCCKIEAVIQRCYLKKVFLQNPQENPCARVPFLMSCSLKRDPGTGVFLVNIVKFLRTSFL